MPKKSRKDRRKKKNPAVICKENLTSSDLLQGFKSLWNTGLWADALTCYRTWTKRTGKKRDVLIEGELLFRTASYHFKKGNYPLTLQYLDEAIEKDNDQKKRYLFYKGICLARYGKTADSIDIFRSLTDNFHRYIMEYLDENKKDLPEEIPGYFAFERSQLTRFWSELKRKNEVTVSSEVLQKVGKAYMRFASGGNPEAQLTLLKGKTGFKTLARHLLLINGVYRREYIKIRNLIRSNPHDFSDSIALHLLDMHLVYCLNEKKYKEISTLMEILKDSNLKPGLMQDSLNELNFQLGLAEIDNNNLEKALGYFETVQNQTPPVLHNTALLLQKLGRYAKANDYWIQLHRREDKPKRSDSSETRLAYTAVLKYIAKNFLQYGKPGQAFSHFKEALSINREDEEIIELLKTTSAKLGNHQEACHYAKRLYELDPDNEEYLVAYIMELNSLKRLDLAIPLYRRGIEKNPDDPFYKEGLAFCLAQSTWHLRNIIPDESKKLINEAKKIDPKIPQILYIEGFFLKKAGKEKAALHKFKQAVDYIKDHSTQFQLGKAFYQDGMIDFSLKIFKSITACTCWMSDNIFEDIIKFLAEKDDFKTVKSLCSLAMKTKDYDLYSLAALLLDYRKPSWALEYSSKLIRKQEADEDDRYLHLLILNKIGAKEETFQYARTLHEEMMQNNDQQGITYYKYLIKQIKTKGRFKHPDD